MARRKSKAKPRTRRAGSVNLVNAAQAFAQTAIITRAAFNTNPIEFLTGQQQMMGFRREGSEEVSYSVQGYFPNSNGTQLTLPELLGFDGGESEGSVSFGSGGMESIRANIALNGGLFKPVMQTVGLNIGFAIGKKVFSKQRSLMNKGAKLAGLSSMVKF